MVFTTRESGSDSWFGNFWFRNMVWFGNSVRFFGSEIWFGNSRWFGNLVRKFSLGGWQEASHRSPLLAQARVMDADGGMDDADAADAAIRQVLDAVSDAELDDVLEAAARLPDQVFKRRGALLTQHMRAAKERRRLERQGNVAPHVQSLMPQSAADQLLSSNPFFIGMLSSSRSNLGSNLSNLRGRLNELQARLANERGGPSLRSDMPSTRGREVGRSPGARRPGPSDPGRGTVQPDPRVKGQVRAEPVRSLVGLSNLRCSPPLRSQEGGTAEHDLSWTDSRGGASGDRRAREHTSGPDRLQPLPRDDQDRAGEATGSQGSGHVEGGPQDGFEGQEQGTSQGTSEQRSGVRSLIGGAAGGGIGQPDARPVEHPSAIVLPEEESTARQSHVEASICAAEPRRCD